MISVVVPTVTGRESWLDQCLAAYEQTTPRGTFETIVIRDRPTCGIAWQEGADRAAGDYIHFTADDIVPHSGWWQAAAACVKSGRMPCPRVLNPDGSLQSCGEWGQEMPDGTDTYIARVPFLSRAQWAQVGPSLRTHYYTDNWIAVRGRQAGIQTVVCRDMVFTHHFAPEGRLGQAVLEADYDVFRSECARVVA